MLSSGLESETFPPNKITHHFQVVIVLFSQHMRPERLPGHPSMSKPKAVLRIPGARDVSNAIILSFECGSG